MKIKELIEFLSKQDQESEVYYAVDDSRKSDDLGWPSYMLFDLEAEVLPQVNSVGNCNPKPGHRKTNVVVLV